MLAELINWMLWSYDAANVPADFRPYSTSEVSALRRNPLRADAGTVRAALLAFIEGVEREMAVAGRLRT